MYQTACLGPCTVPEPLWTPLPFAWRTKAVEWLQVMWASRPGPSRAPQQAALGRAKDAGSQAENRATPRIKATTCAMPALHLRHFGNVCAHQGEIWYRSAIKGPAPLSHKEVAAKDWNARPLFSFPAPAPAPAVSLQAWPASSCGASAHFFKKCQPRTCLLTLV